MNTLTPKHI